MLGAHTKTFKSYGKNKTNVRSKIITTNWSTSSESDSSPPAIKTKPNNIQLSKLSLIESSSSSEDEEEEEVTPVKVKSKLNARDLALAKLKTKREGKVIVGNKKPARVDDQENVVIVQDSPSRKAITVKGKVNSGKGVNISKGKGREVEVEVEIIIDKQTPPKPRLITKLVEIDVNSPLVRKIISKKEDEPPVLIKRIPKGYRGSKSTATMGASSKKMTVHSDESEPKASTSKSKIVDKPRMKKVVVVEIPLTKTKLRYVDNDDDDVIIVESQPIVKIKELSLPILKEELSSSPPVSTRSPVLLSSYTFPKSLSPLLSFTTQSNSLDFTSFVSSPPPPFTSQSPSQWKKVGEASYSEVFSSEGEGGEKLVVKVIPIKTPGVELGENDDIDYPMASGWESVLREMEITDLVGGDGVRLEGFVQFKGAFIVQGKYPSQLLSSWDEFKAVQAPFCDDQIRPDVLPTNQVYAVLCLVHAGKDLESYKIKSWTEAMTIFRQIVKISSLAEKAIEFEHRDLHVGNVLVRKIDPLLALNSGFSQLSFGTRGSLASTNSTTVRELTDQVEVTFIDFTLSRAKRLEDGKIFFDNFNDEELFNGDGVENEGDYQFDIYRYMSSETKENWSSFHPRTNLVWLHYLLLKLLSSKFPTRRTSSSPCSSPISSPRRQSLAVAPRWASSLMLVHPTAARKVKTLSSIPKKRLLTGVGKELKGEVEARENLLRMEEVLRESLGDLGKDWIRKRGGGFRKVKSKNGEGGEREKRELECAGDFYEACF